MKDTSARMRSCCVRRGGVDAREAPVRAWSTFAAVCLSRIQLTARLLASLDLHLGRSLRGTLCLEVAPTVRARMAVYIALLCNDVPPPAGYQSWIAAMQFPDARELNRT